MGRRVSIVVMIQVPIDIGMSITTAMAPMMLPEESTAGVCGKLRVHR